MEKRFDVVIIGAGPAGSTAAALLAAKGRRVAVIERQPFPRYSVGESLLPWCYFTLERLGLIEQLKASHFPKKYSVQFVGTSGNVSQPFYFFQHFDHPAATTWQVLRSEFDKMLLENAVGRGATVLSGLTAKGLCIENDAVTGVRVEDERGERSDLRGAVTLDASGRNAFAATRLGWRVRDAKLKKMAIWTYYKGARRDPGLDEGATTVAYIPEKEGWFWYIPLPADTVSVGIVAEREYLHRESRDPDAIFRREIENNQWIAEHLAPARPSGEYRITGDFSYRSRHSAMDGLLLVGDAFAFLDPVFSSGVFLALKSGEMAADAVDEALREGEAGAAETGRRAVEGAGAAPSGPRPAVRARCFEDYSERLCHALEAMRKLVYAFYDPGFRFRSLLEKYPHLRGDLTDCLIGNLDRDFTDLFAAVGEFAELPEPLAYGRPMGAPGNS